MARFFEMKAQLFGEELLTKKITMTDLTEKDLQVFKCGYVTVLPLTDQTGRPVMFCDGTKLDIQKLAVESILRCYWYLQTTVIDDESAQKMGVCAVLNVAGGSLLDIMGDASTIARKGSYVLNCVPIRFSGFHFCYDDHRLEFLIHTLRAASGRQVRLRFRAHLGSEIENEFKLMTFGIRGDALLRKAREADTLIHRLYIHRRVELDRQYEEKVAREESESSMIAYPRMIDILIGRGQPYKAHPGNDLWNRLLCEQLDRYVESNHNCEKSSIIVEVIKKANLAGARLLCRTTVGWKELDDATAREKTAIAFRTRAKAAGFTPGGAKMRLAAKMIAEKNDNESKRLRYGVSNSS